MSQHLQVCICFVISCNLLTDVSVLLSPVPGDRLVVVNMGFARVGLACCFDYRFPRLFQHYASEMGADLVLVPAACTVPTGSVHWKCLLRARPPLKQVCASLQLCRACLSGAMLGFLMGGCHRSPQCTARELRSLHRDQFLG